LIRKASMGGSMGLGRRQMRSGSWNFHSKKAKSSSLLRAAYHRWGVLGGVGTSKPPKKKSFGGGTHSEAFVYWFGYHTHAENFLSNVRKKNISRSKRGRIKAESNPQRWEKIRTPEGGVIRVYTTAGKILGG